AEAGVPEGLLVIAEHQTRGKGRLGRFWFSPPRAGIYASLLLRPALRPEQAPGFTLLAAVALARALWQVTGLKAGIKWPNDLLLEGKKFSGILTEMKGELDRIHYLVIGTGINVNTDPGLFPPEFRERATSLKAVLGKEVSRVELLAAYLQAFAGEYEIYLQHGLAPILKDWKEWNVTLGRWVTVELGSTVFEGLAVDLDDNGALLVRDERGELRTLQSGEVTLSKK
ncbi:MAG TPA: biotin--[acetyl-CoA-carboxylase] ligase, partial [Clostridia bacterium]|nr:biotin--[acetyl-CoA-carboxylase] ligase [Clostridia bacterium]